MQNAAFGPDNYAAICPACGHRLFLHGFGQCGEIVGQWFIEHLGANADLLRIPACGCSALVCNCTHALGDHGTEGCEHRTRDMYDQGDRDCDCQRTDVEIWDAAVTSQRVGENRAVAQRAVESLRRTLGHEPKMVEMIAEAIHRAETDEDNRLLQYVDVVRSVENDENRHESDRALDAVFTYGLLLARLSGGPEIEGEPAVVRGLRLAAG